MNHERPYVSDIAGTLRAAQTVHHLKGLLLRSGTEGYDPSALSPQLTLRKIPVRISREQRIPHLKLRKAGK